MTSIPYRWDDDVEADRAWRQEMARCSIEVGDVLAAIDDLIAREPGPEKHPLYSLVAHALDRTTMPGTSEALATRYGRFIDQAIAPLVEPRLAEPSGWEA
jgi:hypothetical protein